MTFHSNPKIDNNAMKIKGYYLLGALYKEYIPLIEKHQNGLISDIEFLCECNLIKNKKNQSSFKSLKEVNEEVEEIFS